MVCVRMMVDGGVNNKKMPNEKKDTKRKRKRGKVVSTKPKKRVRSRSRARKEEKKKKPKKMMEVIKEAPPVPMVDDVKKNMNKAVYFGQLSFSDLVFHQDMDKKCNKSLFNRKMTPDKRGVYDAIKGYDRIQRMDRKRDYYARVRGPMMTLNQPLAGYLGNFGRGKFPADTFEKAKIELNTDEYVGWGKTAEVRRSAKRENDKWFEFQNKLLVEYSRACARKPMSHLKQVRASLDKATVNALGELIFRAKSIARRLANKEVISKIDKRFYTNHKFLASENAHNMVTAGKVIGVPDGYSSQGAYLRSGKSTDGILPDDLITELNTNAYDREMKKCKETGAMTIPVKINAIAKILKDDWLYKCHYDGSYPNERGDGFTSSRVSKANVRLFRKLSHKSKAREEKRGHTPPKIRIWYKDEYVGVVDKNKEPVIDPVTKKQKKKLVHKKETKVTIALKERLNKRIYDNYHTHNLKMHELVIKTVSNRRLNPFIPLAPMDVVSIVYELHPYGSPSGKFGIRFEPVGLSWYCPDNRSIGKDGKMLSKGAGMEDDDVPDFTDGVEYDSSARSHAPISKDIANLLDQKAGDVSVVNSLP